MARGLGLLAAAVDHLASEDLARLTDAQAAQRVLLLRGLIERLEGHWLHELAGVDGRGAAGADQGMPAESTAAWLRQRTRMGHTDATRASASPERCIADPWVGPPRPWPTARSATRTPPR